VALLAEQLLEAAPQSPAWPNLRAGSHFRVKAEVAAEA
jgi:hypothetical protein